MKFDLSEKSLVRETIQLEFSSNQRLLYADQLFSPVKEFNKAFPFSEWFYLTYKKDEEYFYFIRRIMFAEITKRQLITNHNYLKKMHLQVKDFELTAA